MEYKCLQNVLFGIIFKSERARERERSNCRMKRTAVRSVRVSKPRSAQLNSAKPSPAQPSSAQLSSAQLSLPLDSPGFFLGLIFHPEIGGVISSSETSDSIRTTRRYDPYSLGHVILMEVHRFPSTRLHLNWHEVELKLISKGCEIVCIQNHTP
jgi:hypothetical protein